MNLGEKIYFSRKKKALSQADLANLLNVEVGMVQQWESNSIQPDTNHLVQISNILDVSLDFLLKDANSGNEKVASTSKSEHQVIHVTKKRLNRRRYNKIKTWLIIGCIFTPLSFGASLTPVGIYALIALSLYAVTIPLCVGAARCCNRAQSRDDMIGWGVAAIIMLSVLGGVLMLSTRNEAFENINEAKAAFLPKENEVEVKQERSVSEEKKQPAVVVRSVDYKKKADTYLKDKSSFITFIKDNNKKNKIQEKLNSLKLKTVDIETIEQYSAFIDEVDEIIKPIESAYNRRVISTAFIILGVLVAATAVILIPTLIASNENAKKRREAKYEELIELVYSYDPENNYRIDSLIDDLYSYYDLTNIMTEYNNAEYYNLLLKEINQYAGEKSNKTNISIYLSRISDGYKQRDLIASDYDNLQTYESTISWDTSRSAPNNVTMEKASANREAVSFIYKYANKSGLWNYDRYIQKISIPYLIYGAECINEINEHGFAWYLDDEGQHLQWALPKPSAYDESEAYYFSTTYSTENNTFKFYLELQSDTSKTIDIFTVESIKYIASKQQFSATVYLYGTGLKEDFYFTI